MPQSISTVSALRQAETIATVKAVGLGRAGFVPIHVPGGLWGNNLGVPLLLPR